MTKPFIRLRVMYPDVERRSGDIIMAYTTDKLPFRLFRGFEWFAIGRVL